MSFHTHNNWGRDLGHAKDVKEGKLPKVPSNIDALTRLSQPIKRRAKHVAIHEDARPVWKKPLPPPKNMEYLEHASRPLRRREKHVPEPEWIQQKH
jgi:hypothetical protein